MHVHIKPKKRELPWHQPRPEYGPGLVGVAGDVELAVAHLPQNGGRLDQPEEHQGGAPRFDVGANAFLSLPIADDRADLGQVSLDHAEYFRLPRWAAAVRLLREHHAQDALVLAQQLDVSHEEPLQALEGIDAFRADDAHVAQQALRDEIKGGIQDLILAPEVPVDSRRHQPDTLGDGGHAQSLHAVAEIG